MPQPTTTQVHVDAPLTMISVAFIQAASAFIAPRVFPQIPVDKQSDLYYVYDKDAWFRDEAQMRGPSEESAGSGYTNSTDNYKCRTWAVHKDVDDQTRANTDAPMDADRDATNFVTQRMLLRLEKQWADDNFKTGVWTTDMTGVASSPSGSQFIQWSDYAASDPITDIETGRRAVLVKTGFKPNKLVLGWDVYIKLKNHPDFVDRVKYTGGVKEQVEIEKILAQMFGLDEVIVAESVINTAKEGQAGTYSFVHGKQALLCYVAPNPGILVPSAGYQFVWKGISSGLGQRIAVSRFRIEKIKSDRIEAEMAFDNKVVAADLGYFFTSAVA